MMTSRFGQRGLSLARFGRFLRALLGRFLGAFFLPGPPTLACSQKATYPALYGMEASHAQLEIVHQAAGNSLANLGRPTQLLLSIANFILGRQT